MGWRIIVVILLFALTPISQAGSLYGGFGLYAGKSYFNLDNLNNSLTRNGYPKAREDLTTLGFDAYLILRNRVVLGIEYGHYGSSAIGVGGSHSVSGMKLMVYIGYSLIEKEKWRLRPEIGIGGTDLNFTFTTAENGIDFDDVISFPFRSVRIGIGPRNILIGLAYDRYLFQYKPGQFVNVGIKVNYSFGEDSEIWDGDFVSIENGPKIHIEGLSISVVVGISGRLE
ncbi:MAG: hypothetical protein V3W18_02890 [candidate division Zixibacteria bacterium]